MKDLVTDAIAFFKMVGGSDELSNKGFDTGDIMTLDYCNKIVELCKKYNILCDDTMPYGILDAEYDLEKFFKTKLEEAVKEEIKMCECFKCEMLIDDEPIKVVDFPVSNPFDQELFHFEDGYRCQFNGRESLVVRDLQKGKCRLRR